MSVLVLPNHVGGRDVPPVSGEYLDDLAPATSERIARVPRSGGADVDAAVAAARRAFEGRWRRAPLAERADLCEAVARRLEERAEELAELESRDTGKPIRLARTVDIPRAVANFRFFAGAVRHDQTGCHPMDGALNYTLRAPLGVCALVTPWNLPIYLLSWKAAPAIAMGNTVVAKPSELTPLTASALADVFREVGAPEGVFNLVHGLGAEAGQALVEHPGVAAVSFTGGTATGARVAAAAFGGGAPPPAPPGARGVGSADLAAAAPRFKKLSLELGGKNPTIVFADCDLEPTVEGSVRAGFLNQGQVCLCGSRVLVERRLHDRFVEAYVARVGAMRVGDPSDPATELGSLISQAHREKVEGYLKLALEEGGTILCGGQRPELPGPLASGAFVTPAVIAGLPPTCRTAQEEIFGPVVTVHPFDTEEEAVAIANGVRYGLSASVWTRDLARAHRVSAALETGMVWVNTWLLRDLRVPFGGVKESGVGREGGTLSLEFFSEARNVCVKL